MARFRPPTTDEPELRIQLEVPSAAPDELARFNQWLARHRYLKAARWEGEQLREAATDRGPWLALAAGNAGKSPPSAHPANPRADAGTQPRPA